MAIPSSTSAPAHPMDVVFHQSTGRLAILWSDGVVADLGSQALRAACRCGGCEQARRDGRAVPAPPGVMLTGLQPFGGSGLQLRFDDGHDRGLYPWPYLHELSLGSPLTV